MFSARFSLDVDLSGLATPALPDAAPLAVCTEVLFMLLVLACDNFIGLLPGVDQFSPGRVKRPVY